MIVLLDIGNARLKWATLVNNQFEFRNAIYLQDPDWLQRIANDWSTIGIPQQILAVNVTSSSTIDQLAQWIKEHWNQDIHFIKAAKEAFGIFNGYSEPEKLGVDRFVSLIAAWKKVHKPLCLVSCGTCIVIDVVDGKGHHQGGWIAPGLVLMQESVIQGASGCASAIVDYHPGQIAPANDTQDAVSHGSLLMAVAFINQTVSDLQKKWGDELICFLSGGDAKWVQPFLSTHFEYEPHLVLKGLADFQ